MSTQVNDACKEQVSLPPFSEAGEELKGDEAQSAYQVATALYMQENQITWDRFNVMVTANSIIIAAAAIAFQERESFLIALAFVLPVIGLLLCHTWEAMTRRAFLYHDLWRAAAFKLEYEAFHGRIHTVEYAEQFRYGHRETVVQIGHTSRRFATSCGKPQWCGTEVSDKILTHLDRMWGFDVEETGPNKRRAGDLAMTSINVFRTLYVLMNALALVVGGIEIVR